ncbi:MAG: alpha/beta hydrolase [Bacteroidales bacterium]|nr:alpha/beta hydrolase [Bacteroidales bacterium]
MKKFICMLIAAVLVLSACNKLEVKTGYVKVPTVTKNALSGVCNILEPTSPIVRLYYEEAGQGEPLILLHEQTLDCRMWDDVFLKLAKNFRVIRYDLRGYGKSGSPESGYGYLHADDLKNMMDSMGIKKAHFAGLALGGMVLADFVALYPEKVMTATMTSGALSDFPDRSQMPAEILKLYNNSVYAMKTKKVEEFKKSGLNEYKQEWKLAMRSVTGKNYRGISDRLNSMVDDWNAWQLLNPEIDPLIGYQADRLLRNQKRHPRILLIIGLRDAIASKKSMQRMVAVCPDATIRLMSESGHFTCMESPDEFMEKMLTFIRSPK